MTMPLDSSLKSIGPPISNAIPLFAEAPRPRRESGRRMLRTQPDWRIWRGYAAVLSLDFVRKKIYFF